MSICDQFSALDKDDDIPDVIDVTPVKIKKSKSSRRGRTNSRKCKLEDEGNEIEVAKIDTNEIKVSKIVTEIKVLKFETNEIEVEKIKSDKVGEIQKSKLEEVYKSYKGERVYKSRKVQDKRNESSISNRKISSRIYHTEATRALKNSNLQYKSPFVHYDSRELCEFTPSFHPENQNIKTLGIYQRAASKHFLIEKPTKLNSKSTVHLDLRLLKNFPSSGRLYEVFGFVQFVENEPVLTVKFLKEKFGDSVDSSCCSLMLRSFLPGNFTRMESRNSKDESEAASFLQLDFEGLLDDGNESLLRDFDSCCDLQNVTLD